jgi:nucleoside-diphosphate-sugar epimerase
MTGRIIVLGAAGRLGFAAGEAFRDAGWKVKGLVRPGRAGAVPHRVEAIEAVTRDEAIAAASGCDVVLNAFNPAITEWRKNALSLAYGAIAAAESNGATLLFPGSVWNYGRNMPPVLDETTPMQPTTRKGAMRVEIEQRIHEACDRGMRAIILRAGDFFGGGSGSWFDLVIAKEIGLRRNPGPARRAARKLRLVRDVRVRRPHGHRQRIHRHDRGGHQKQVHAAADELVVPQNHRPVDGAQPRAFGARIPLARAAPCFR